MASYNLPIAYARREGATDDALVIATAPGSAYLAEIQWSTGA